MQSSIREIVYKMCAEKKKHLTMKSLHSRFMEENPDFKCCVKSIHTWVRQIGFKFRKNEYSKFIQEYLQLNHMQLIKTTPKNDAVYLPHHAVVKESSSTTRLRVVFDGSAKTTNGLSLNDNFNVRSFNPARFILYSFGVQNFQICIKCRYC
jgi:hypothetical protein